MRCYTTFVKQVIPDDTAQELYNYLRKNIDWDEGIRSRNGFTRKAKAMDWDEDEFVHQVLKTSLEKVSKQSYDILGIYLNYYKNGFMYTPSHSHKGTHQFVLSLGAVRTLNVGKKSYSMGNGDAILFGSSTHGVPKEPQIKEGRISIATFMRPIESQPQPCIEYSVETDKEIAYRLQMMEYENY